MSITTPSSGSAEADLLGDLTDPQRAAVTSTEGPELVLAAAGSGKTRVITRRLAWLIRIQNVPPWQVLAITFTNKAANEMRQRVGQLLGERRARAASVSTFHSLCARLLRQYADRLNLPAGYSIYDTNDQMRVMRDAIKALDMKSDNFAPGAMLSTISNAKNQLIDAETYAAEARDFLSRSVARIYLAYQKTLIRNQALDFDDLLMRTAQLLQTDAEARRELQERWRYVMIDEYQDTNHAQFILAQLLSAGHRNICVVGDPDQSIYGWRGANLGNILDFEKHFPEAKVIKLGQNYRSTPQILTAADHLIQHNRMRRHKPLFTENPDGEKIELACASDEEHEVELAVNWMRQLRDAGTAWRDMAVFYRINAQSRVVEEGLLHQGIPYQVARGTAFYDRQEIRDAIAYLRVLSNPADEVSLLRIINTPTRGIGQTTIRRVQAHAQSAGITTWQALHHAEAIDGLTNRSITPIMRFVKLYETWQQKMTDGAQETLGFVPAARDVVEMVIRDSGLEAHYRAQDEEKAENLAELITAAQSFDEQYADEAADLAQRLRDYLESIALISDVDGLSDAEGAVTLMTLHAAKGLEFAAVAILGLEEGLLPHRQSMDKADQLEEERRLLFVGITRAQQRLHLSHARYRSVRGISERAIPSQFVRELPDDELNVLDLSDQGNDWDDDSDIASVASAWQRPRSGRGGRSHVEDFEFVDADIAELEHALPIGCMVRHPRFGVGRVVSVTGAGRTARARVDFVKFGTKTLVLEYARLELLGE